MAHRAIEHGGLNTMEEQNFVQMRNIFLKCTGTPAKLCCRTPERQPKFQIVRSTPRQKSKSSENR